MKNKVFVAFAIFFISISVSNAESCRSMARFKYQGGPMIKWTAGHKDCFPAGWKNFHGNL